MRFTEPDHPQTSERSARAYAFAGLVGLALAMGVGRFAFTPLFPLMQTDAALSVTDGAWLAAANYLGYFVGAVAALAVNSRPSTLIRASLVANAAATIGMGCTHAFAAWLAWRGLAGIASAFLLVFISALSLQRLAPLARPMLGAAVFSGVGAGIFAVGTLCLGLEYLGFGSSEVWIALGVLSAVLSLAVWPVFTDDRTSDPAEDTVRRVAQPRRARWPLVVCYGLFGFGYIIPATFLPVMAKAAVGTGWTFGLSWPAFGFAAFVSTFIAARVSRRASGISVWRIAQIVMAIGVALPALLPGLGAVVVAAICVGGTFMMITMLGMQTAKQVGAGNPTRLMAAMTVAFAAGQLAGPLSVSGFVDPDAGLSGILLAAAAALLVGVALLARSGVHDERAAIDSVRRKVRAT